MTTTTGMDDARRGRVLGRGFEDWDLGTAENAGTRLGYRTAGEGPVVALLHGFPQTGYAWHAVAADLVRDHRVVVLDNRGTGGSDVPPDGYDKATMAGDLHAVLGHVGAGSAHVVGHDLGLMVAHARRFPAATRSLVLVDGIVPGTDFFARSTARAWHFGFHTHVDLAVSLVQGREDRYLAHFLDGYLTDPAALPATDRAFYLDELRRPGALAAAFRTYAAATTTDVAENRRALAAGGPLTLPVLGIGGEASLGPVMDAVVAEVALDPRSTRVAGSGHYVPDEQPGALAAVLRTWAHEHPDEPGT